MEKIWLKNYPAGVPAEINAHGEKVRGFLNEGDN